MDPFTAIGLASNIISFIDFGTKLVIAAYEVYESKDGATADVVNQKITNADLLGLVDLLKLPAQRSGVVLQPHEQRLENLRMQCFEVAEALNRKLQNVSLGNIGNHTVWNSFKVAVKSMWNRKDIAEFQRQLAVFKEEMELHIVVDIRISAENLESTQKLRFDSLDQDLKITARSIETRLTSIRTLIEKQITENQGFHQKAVRIIENSTAELLGTMGREGDATRAGLARTEAVIIEQIQQLSLQRPDVIKPILVDSTFVCDPQYFISRMTYIDDLLKGFKYHKRMLLIGLGGVGKSQIAIDYANRLRREDPYLSYIWVYGSTQSTFVDSYRKILGQIPKEYREDQVKIIRGSSDVTDNGYTDEEVLRLVCEWFSSPKSGRWLMVLDNVDNLDLFKSARVGDVRLKTTLPRSDLGRLLITSRTQQISSILLDGGQECTVKVRTMTAMEAVMMFRALLNSDDSTEDQILELATKLDFLPLAIRQATSYIAASCGRTTISAYSILFDKIQYQSRLLKAEFADSSRPGEDITNSVVVTWQISFREIERQRPLATKMLAFIGVLSRESIPVFLLRAIQLDELEFDLDLGILIQHSLVDQDAGKTLLSLHRLVQLTIRLWLADAQAEIEWHEKALAIIKHEFLKAMSTNHFQRRDVATCRALRIHAIKVCRYNFDAEHSKQGCQELMASLKDFDKLSLTWLQAGNQTEIHQATSARRALHTGNWLFDTNEYQKWIRSPGELLTICGSPGSGKTVLSSFVIDHFKSLPLYTHKLLFYYCQFGRSSADSIFRELLHQFCAGEDQIPSAIEKLNTRYESMTEAPSVTDLLVVFQSVVEESVYEVIVVIDALDECSAMSRSLLLQALSSLSRASVPNLHLLVCSRKEAEIFHHLHFSLQIDLNRFMTSIDSDMHSHVVGKVRKWLDPMYRREDQSDFSKVEEALVKISAGRFVWANFAIEMLRQYCQSPSFRMSLSPGKDLLQQLSIIPEDLHSIYQLTLQHLMDLDHIPKDLVESLFMWVIYAKRTLSLDELVQAVGAPSDIQGSRAENKQRYIQDVGGLFINFENGSACLAHFTIHEFFCQPNNELFQEPGTSHLTMANKCLDCLLSCTSSTISESIFTEQPLLRYAAEYWPQHLKECSKEDLTERIMEQCDHLFDPKKPQAFLNWLRIHDPEHPERRLQLNATIEDFSPRTRYISICGVPSTSRTLEGT
ncbi:hypothetical protein VTL71DRAFT_10503 [Oculimacula yallundae]|uniref:Nephrocystin 3-like N-terminal domain-containing protein n=1 Tax=Oculimacula yallundae TaxID=86028 RepID=A0ABR4CT70_9HELO